ncbi:MAG: Asp23/Gls24 family envelope stress response protein [Candidatus Omnitrophica bacterium]|nr:Asp23/Gls24 family envelope stress response protein [Candidatus Omnitrophota bacterium]MCM8802536.1 Asp23/Gls24 family envelope stress response protein [Candidatus Omnitrophota bacterium]
MVEEKKELGKVKIDNDVLASIARVAATSVPGVHRVITGLVGGIKKIFGKKRETGIKVILGEGEVSFELSIAVDYGANIPEITYQVQRRIKEEVEKISGLKVLDVDVLVKEIKIPKRDTK